MTALLPTEFWEYKFNDFIRGMFIAFGSRDQINTITIRNIGDCVAIRSGRVGLVLALKALGLGTSSTVGVPLYCCPIVFKAVEKAGCKLCFIDIDPSTYCLSAEDLSAKISRVDAVIAVHMFGNMCDMPRVLEAAQGKPIVEDCAQALGSKLNGRSAGSFGAVAAFSFRSGKYISVGEGGALYSCQKNILTRLSVLNAAMPVPSCFEECVHVIKTYIRSKLRQKPLWGLIGREIWDIYNKNSKQLSTSLTMGQIHKTDLVLAGRRLVSLDSSIQKQRANALCYEQELNNGDNILCIEKNGSFYNRYLYPVNLKTEEHREIIAEYLNTKKICTTKPYKDIVEIALKHYGYKGDCPISEQISKSVILLPCNYGLKTSEIRRIARCFNASLDVSPIFSADAIYQ